MRTYMIDGNAQLKRARAGAQKRISARLFDGNLRARTRARRMLIIERKKEFSPALEIAPVSRK